MEINDLTEKIIGCAIKVHRNLGAGLLESTYEICLVHELKKIGLKVESQVSLPVYYDGIKLEAGYKIDVLIEDKVIVELKAVERILPIHEAQILTYLKLANKKIGLLINFNVKVLKDGITRKIN
ncbi:MAG: GxxExxY protein [Pyrinomonadaceae bacterium]|nr:GxxExxY protein [Pyrinomonadaceae bacterium]